MQLQDLQIERERYGIRKGQLTGRIKFVSDTDEETLIQLALDESQCLSILDICAVGIIAHAQQASNLLVEEVTRRRLPAVTQD